MASHQQTLSLIREITNDGVVTDDEVITLATYLNETREARKSWPGVAVFQILKDILADGVIDEVEKQALEEILEGVEVICAGQARPAESNGGEASVPVSEPDESRGTILKLPELEPEQVMMRIEDPGAAHQLVRYACTCDNWLDVRSAMPATSPGRACKCVTRELAGLFKTSANVAKQWPSELVAVIRHAAKVGRGLDPVENWRAVKAGQLQFVISTGKTPWYNIYECISQGDMEKFSYHRALKRWGHGASPRAADLLEPLLSEGKI
ncbi:MAG: hypothetical protein ACPGVU_10795 [Limisphaerales bacterium]